ncbi:hypothetical protein GBF38_018098 [Nibea albiflora]|uniref:Uncharacterized protein n=1 Tax=Nibea albiflora TaxID=240163 RepID=A0ACB7EGV0_NIBAL|nr:hypothetical protein GBF38_018098 [Nibea albiflora]
MRHFLSSTAPRIGTKKRADSRLCTLQYMRPYNRSTAWLRFSSNASDDSQDNRRLSITKPQVTAKLKGIRTKYRKAVNTGRRRGQGRVVLLYFELCEEIWGGPPATRAIDAGIETADMDEESPQSSPPSQSPTRSSSPIMELPGDSTQSPSTPESLPSAAKKQRRDSLQARLNNHSGGGLKRRLRSDQVALEDLQIKWRMLELMEEASKRNIDTMQQINTNIAKIANSIQEGFSLMREMMLRPACPCSSSSSGFGQHQPTFMHMAPHPATAACHQTPDRPAQPENTPTQAHTMCDDAEEK